MNKCTFCGREANSGTKHVGGYTILEVCTGCERDITGEREVMKPIEAKTYTDSTEYFEWLQNGAEDRIYSDLDNNRTLEDITVTFYGQTLVIDTHADNYEAFCAFIRRVVENN